MALTPRESRLMDIVVEVIYEDPQLHHLIEKGVAKRKFERVNGLEGECTCQK